MTIPTGMMVSEADRLRAEAFYLLNPIEHLDSLPLPERQSREVECERLLNEASRIEQERGTWS